MERKKPSRVFIAAEFMILMAALGAGDSLRGVFAPAFQRHFTLNATELSVIIMVSYLGNLCFLCLGGRALDRFNRKKVVVGLTAVWIGALLLFGFADNRLCLLAGMFLAMGSSTLLNTAVTILTPSVFVTNPGMMVNIFFFIQGTGTSLSQNIAGRGADSYRVFRLVSVLLAVMGAVSLLFLWRTGIPGREADRQTGKPKTVSYKTVIHRKGFGLLVLMFGCYFIAEHGIMNWLVSYGTNALKISPAKGAMYLSGFYGGITVGRLLLAPVVAKAGAFKSIRWFGGLGTVLFVLGILLRGRGLVLLSLSGLAVSVVYPTLVYLVRYFYPAEMLGTGLGMVISGATLFDVGFNVLFGRMIDVWGYRNSFLVLPLCMAGFYCCYLIFQKNRNRESDSFVVRRE